MQSWKKNFLIKLFLVKAPVSHIDNVYLLLFTGIYWVIRFIFNAPHILLLKILLNIENAKYKI